MVAPYPLKTPPHLRYWSGTRGFNPGTTMRHYFGVGLSISVPKDCQMEGSIFSVFLFCSFSPLSFAWPSEPSSQLPRTRELLPVSVVTYYCPYSVIAKLELRSDISFQDGSFHCLSRTSKEYMLGIIFDVSGVSTSCMGLLADFIPVMVENTMTGKNLHRMIIYVTIFRFIKSC
jgi:hypothetical protein